MSFSRHVDHLLYVDWQTIAALALICAVAAYFIKDGLAHPPVVLLVCLFLFNFSILARYFLREGERLQPRKRDPWLMWAILTTMCGPLIPREWSAGSSACAPAAGAARLSAVRCTLDPRCRQASACAALQSG
jgi:hypothetical protein